LCEEHKCICGVTVKKDGLHGLSCASSAGWIPRHDQVNKIFSHAFSSAGHPNILQPPGISREVKSKDYLLQRVSIAIQRGNAASILGTLGKQKIDDVYNL